jgi:hypothetical protein
MEYPADAVIDWMFNNALPVFVKVTFCWAEVVFTGTDPKSMELVLKEIDASPPELD